MLFGEHSVLKNGFCIVAALDYWVTVMLESRTDDVISVTSTFGQEQTSIHTIALSHKLSFVQAAIRNCPPCTGVCITIQSQISSHIGLGSSAAITAALLYALYTFSKQHWNTQQILSKTVECIRSVQGVGSGADAAASIFGGVILYNAHTQNVLPLAHSLPIVLEYSGYKTPTPQVIEFVRKREKQFPELYNAIFSGIDIITQKAAHAIQNNDLATCGQLMNSADGLMQALGIGTNQLSSICWNLRSLPSILGAKISGSGLGDCAIGLGSAPKSSQQIPVSITPQGTHIVT